MGLNNVLQIFVALKKVLRFGLKLRIKNWLKQSENFAVKVLQVCTLQINVILGAYFQRSLLRMKTCRLFFSSDFCMKRASMFAYIISSSRIASAITAAIPSLNFLMWAGDIQKSHLDVVAITPVIERSPMLFKLRLFIDPGVIPSSFTEMLPSSLISPRLESITRMGLFGCIIRIKFSAFCTLPASILFSSVPYTVKGESASRLPTLHPSES